MFDQSLVSVQNEPVPAGAAALQGWEAGITVENKGQQGT